MKEIRSYSVIGMVFRLMFDKAFRCWFLRSLDYALDNHEDKRGSGAGDVLIFKKYHLSKIVSDVRKVEECDCNICKAKREESLQ